MTKRHLHDLYAAKLLNTLTLSDKSTRFNQIIEHYLGSSEAMSDEDRDWIEDNNLCERLDELMFLCDKCGWWCSEDKRNPDGDFDLCNDCDE